MLMFIQGGSLSSQVTVSWEIKFEKIFLLVLLNKKIISLMFKFLKDFSQDNCSVACWIRSTFRLTLHVLIDDDNFDKEGNGLLIPLRD